MQLKRCDDLLRLARDNLHSFPYKEVPLHWRRLYTDVSLVKAALMTLSDADDESIVAALDMALIMTGAPGEGRKEAIDDLLEALDEAHRRKNKRQKSEELRFDVMKDSMELLQHPVERWETPPSLEEFQQYLLSSNRPIIICGAISHWPALSSHPWASPEYLLSLTNRGMRLVPVEVGRAYTDPSWGQKIVTFRDFLDTYMTSEAAEIGYLAQHTLFTQIPKLRNDIVIPDYCYSDPGKLPDNVAPTPPLEEPLINAWLGPRGTVSPLHTDPYANVLAQVMGSKYVRLYAPQETPRLFPRGIEEGGVDMSNTSRIEVEAEGGGEELMEEEREVWKQAEYVECVLKEGELLFIPAGWWHYVRSLEASFSVSFWWN
jgi:hypothetical protein